MGDTAEVDPDDGGAPIAGRVDYVSPIGASDTQTALARVVIPNDGLRLRPGLFAVGTITLAEQPVDLAVRANALQTIDGRSVVFVRNGHALEPRDVEIGTRDAEWAVLFGLMPGDVYAAKNSIRGEGRARQGERQP